MSHWSDPHREKWKLEDDFNYNIARPHPARLLWERADDDAVIELPDHALPPEVVEAMTWCVQQAQAACTHTQAAIAAGASDMIETIVVNRLPILSCLDSMCVAQAMHTAMIWKLHPDETCIACKRPPALRTFMTRFRDGPSATTLVCRVCDDCAHDWLSEWFGLPTTGPWS